MKGNIAVCFSGQLRCHHKLTYNWEKRFFSVLKNNDYNIVIFFHHNNDYLDTLDTIYKDYSKYEIYGEISGDIMYDQIFPDLFKLPAYGLNRGGHNQLLREFNSMDKVIQMKKNYEEINNITFDYVFKTRFDVTPIMDFDINLLNNDAFYISDHDHHNGYNARFTMTSSILSDNVYQIINNINKVSKTVSEFSGEPYWKSHLEYFNFNVKFLNFKVGLVRDYDNKLPLHERGIISNNGHKVCSFNNELNKIIY